MVPLLSKQYLGVIGKQRSHKYQLLLNAVYLAGEPQLPVTPEFCLLSRGATHTNYSLMLFT
jgi:hypothetical protein